MGVGRIALAICGVLIGCGKTDPPRSMPIRLATPERVETAVGRELEWVKDHHAIGVANPPSLRLDGRSEWRYFRVSNELGQGEVVSGGKRIGAFEPTPSLLIPPSFGAAYWFDIAKDDRFRIEARGSFGPDSGLSLSIFALSVPGPPRPERIAPGSLRELIQTSQLGLPRYASHGMSVGRLNYAPPREARSILVMVSSIEERTETLERIDFHRVTPIEWAFLQGQVDEHLLTDVERFGIRRRAWLLPVGSSIETAPLPSVGGGATLRFAVSRISSQSLPPVDGELVMEATVGGTRVELLRVPLGDIPDAWVEKSLPWSMGDGARLAISITGSAKLGECGVAVGSPVIVPASSTSRRNVVLISIDTLRADRLGCYGNERGLTPNIDQVASDGIRFDRAYSHAPYTLPSHVSLFSGMFPEGHGVQQSRDRIPRGVPLLADELARAGFDCAAFTSGGYLSPIFGHGRGFDVYSEVDPLGDRYFPGRVPGAARLAGGETGSLHQALDYFASRRDRDRYLLLHTFLVHCYLPPRELAEEFGLIGEGLPPLTFDAARRFEPGRVAREELSSTDRRLMVDAYDATVKEADAMVGWVMARLRDEGCLDDTLVLITSDHGQELLEHGGTGHGVTLYEELIRVPLIVRVPGGPRGVSVDEVVRHADVLPTLLEWLDLPIPIAVQGESFAGVFRGERILDRPVIAKIEDPIRSIRRALIDNGYKWIESHVDPDLAFRPRAPEELYRLDEDPEERNNLAATKPEIAAILRRRSDDLAEISEKLAELVQRVDSDRMEEGVSNDLEEILKQLGYAGDGR